MTDRDEPPVGSLAEELAKLVGAVAGMSAPADPGAKADTDDADADPQPHRHSASDPACAICPICQMISMVRQTSPEVRDHLTASAVSLAAAARSLVDAAVAYQTDHGGTASPAASGEGVTDIDLDEDEDEDEDEPWD